MRVSYALCALVFASSCASRRAPPGTGSPADLTAVNVNVNVNASAAGSVSPEPTVEPEPPPGPPLPAEGRGTCLARDARRVCFSAGLSQLGRAAPETRFEERPPRAARLGSFELDRDEVTAESYALCVRAGACRAAQCDDGSAPPAQGPARCVSWADARTYCAHRGGRLPSEAEWERAAAGILPTHRTYPWGDVLPQGAPNGEGELAADRSPEGAQHLGGRVAEWVHDVGAFYQLPRDASADADASADGGPSARPSASADPTVDLETADAGASTAESSDPDAGTLVVVDDPRGPPEGAWRVIRGGDLRTPVARWTAAARRFRIPTERRAWIGLRCAYDLAAPPTASAAAAPARAGARR